MAVLAVILTLVVSDTNSLVERHRAKERSKTW